MAQWPWTAFLQVRLPTPVQRVHGLYTGEQHSPVGGAQGWLGSGVFSTIVDLIDCWHQA